MTNTEQQHIAELADVVGARIKYKHGLGRRDAYSIPDEGTVILPRVLRHSWEGYWAALHELGHVALHRGVDKISMEFFQPERIPEFEADAWLWALRHSSEPVTAQVARRIDESISSYTDHYGPGAVNVRHLREQIKEAA